MRNLPFLVNNLQIVIVVVAGQDSIDHIVIAGRFAKHIWSFFASLFGIDKIYTPVRNMVMRWWSTKPKNDAHKLVYILIPYLFIRAYGRIDVLTNMMVKLPTALELYT